MANTSAEGASSTGLGLRTLVSRSVDHSLGVFVEEDKTEIAPLWRLCSSEIGALQDMGYTYDACARAVTHIVEHDFSVNGGLFDAVLERLVEQTQSTDVAVVDGEVEMPINGDLCEHGRASGATCSAHGLTLPASCGSPSIVQADNTTKTKRDAEDCDPSLPLPKRPRLSGCRARGDGSSEATSEMSVSHRANQGLLRPTCPVCLCEIDDVTALYRVGCAHVFHRDCFATHLRFAATTGDSLQIRCPCCPRLVSQIEVRDMVSEDVWDLFVRRRFVQNVAQDMHRCWCPTVNCETILHRPSAFGVGQAWTEARVRQLCGLGVYFFGSGAVGWYVSTLIGYVAVGPKIIIAAACAISTIVGIMSVSRDCFNEEMTKPAEVTCHRCSKSICFECREAWHPGTTCGDLRDEQLLRWAANRDVGQCPKCHIVIQRIAGCNQMTCTKDTGGCGFSFCWMCFEEYKPEHFGSNGKCTMFGEVRHSELPEDLKSFVVVALALARIEFVMLPHGGICHTLWTTAAFLGALSCGQQISATARTELWSRRFIGLTVCFIALTWCFLFMPKDGASVMVGGLTLLALDIQILPVSWASQRLTPHSWALYFGEVCGRSFAALAVALLPRAFSASRAWLDIVDYQLTSLPIRLDLGATIVFYCFVSIFVSILTILAYCVGYLMVLRPIEGHASMSFWDHGAYTGTLARACAICALTSSILQVVSATFTSEYRITLLLALLPGILHLRFSSGPTEHPRRWATIARMLIPQAAFVWWVRMFFSPLQGWIPGPDCVRSQAYSIAFALGYSPFALLWVFSRIGCRNFGQTMLMALVPFVADHFRRRLMALCVLRAVASGTLCYAFGHLMAKEYTRPMDQLAGRL
eukprot:TRINITY_DN18266_c0_g1_i1.p1 TRINITY_DN18266_c0_g1~~TRINITY_DN18266_c0_g1_i1.p1  ORF type:complete len:866 (+),score=108.28 TRINITY_DN18266_c0_g1_i1:77-2674(+)